MTLRDGRDVALVGYGPLLLTNAWRAADDARRAQGISAAVIDLPWLNRIDDDVGRATRSVAFARGRDARQPLRDARARA